MRKAVIQSKITITEQKNILKVIVGNVFLGFAYANWMKPNNIINGGVTSVAMILEKISQIPIFYLTSGVTVLLLIFCWFFLGKGNFLKSIVSSICYNLFFTIFYLLKLNVQINLVVDFLFACVFIAIGYYCCISANASTVGMDVIALAINKKHPEFSIARGIRYINVMVLALGFLTYGVKSVVIGILFSLLNSYMLDFLLKRRIEE
ncbi:YitT family protein [Enterococcus thailandicus]|uniref:YitT family protein n=1 Tax=Enterococcus thailandicus TaxID=417368 RepID=UPI0022EC0DB6|nr:YitT family protein [Enterococcus thailandicus]MDA3973855.1 YitT family protein [Enterococcus thailandicus]MDA3976332.1 YitT family protein [Enterococcus thailandicus]MDA3981297.1 YitT family protein [Enterococcus thailandicus]